MKSVRYTFMILCCFILFFSCDESTKENSDTSVFKKLNGALSVGDLVQFEYDIAALDNSPEEVTYNYRIIEGLNVGVEKTGYLTEIAGGNKTFFRTELGFPFLIYPNNIVMGIPGTADNIGVLVGVPELSSEYTIEEITGIYNFYECSGIPGSPISQYTMRYGTLKILDDGTWISKIGQNLADETVNPGRMGTWIDQGNGIIQVLALSGDKIANMFIHPMKSKSKILVVDICEANHSGMRLGVKQKRLLPNEIIGAYNCLSVVHFDAISLEITDTQIIVPEITEAQTLTMNSPWAGFIESPDLIGLPTIQTDESPKNIFFGGTKPQSQLVRTFTTGIRTNE